MTAICPDTNTASAAIAGRESRQGYDFSLGQRGALRDAMLSKDQFSIIVGAAGSGKTTAMAAIVEQFRQSGHEIIGLAPSRKARRELQSAGADDTLTIASGLLTPEINHQNDAPRIYIVDEAGMISNSDFEKIVQRAHREQARVIFVGDPRQLEAVESGAPLRQMIERRHIKVSRINEIKRQNNPKLKKIAQLFANGDAAGAVARAMEFVTKVDIPLPIDGSKLTAEARRIEVALAAANAFLEKTKEEREKTLVMTATNNMRIELNKQIRRGLQLEGTIAEGGVTIRALDKIDLTKEKLRDITSYQTGHIIQFESDYKDDSRKLLAGRHSQWIVSGRNGDNLILSNFQNTSQKIEWDPSEFKTIQPFKTRRMALAVGDRIVLRTSDSVDKLSNGEIGIITEINENEGSALVKMADGLEVTIDARRARAIDYDYARTVHSAQGATVDHAIIVGEGGQLATAKLAYVASTRERETLQIFTDNPVLLQKSWINWADKQTASQAAAAAQHPADLARIDAIRERVRQVLKTTLEYLRAIPARFSKPIVASVAEDDDDNSDTLSNATMR